MNNDGIVKVNQGMFINTSDDDLMQYKRERAKLKKTKELSARVDSLESEVSRLKKIIQELYSRIQ